MRKGSEEHERLRPTGCDLNDDLRQIVSEMRTYAGDGVEKYAKKLGIEKSRLEQIEKYVRNPGGLGGTRLHTVSLIVSACEMDPVSFFGQHDRYSGRLRDPLATELRRVLTETQIKELIGIAQRLKATGSLESVLAALNAFVRAEREK
jgi:hypothetical protein